MCRSEALRTVRSGDFAVRVVVDDASEIGRLQVGFNAMAAGLAERERIRDVFGTYVDGDVAEHILQGPALQADEVEVTLMFVDVRNFTTFAERLRPIEVVAALNRLFERIVPLVHRHGGHVDKYAGDGLLAVFGAPRRHGDRIIDELAFIQLTKMRSYDNITNAYLVEYEPRHFRHRVSRKQQKTAKEQRGSCCFFRHPPVGNPGFPLITEAPR